MQKATPKQFWGKVAAAGRLAELRAARFAGDTSAKRIRRMAEAVVLPEKFNEHYLPHYFRAVTPPFHALLYLALAWERHVAVRVPRGHAKSTVVTFAYVLHQVACAGILRGLRDDTLRTSSPELYAEIRAVMAEEARRRTAAGPLTPAGLGLPQHWDPKVDEDLAGWLHAVHVRQLAAGDEIPVHWDPYVQILGADLATALEITSSLRLELEENALLRADWGELKPCYTSDWGKAVRRAASDEDFESNWVRVRAFGMDGDLRGGKHGAWRPSLLIGDDPDGERTTRTELQRDGNARKIDVAGEPGLEPGTGRIFLCGTPHHPDCLIVRYTEHEKYRRRYQAIRFRAADERGVRLYAARFSAEHLADIRHQDPAAYESELGDRPPALGGRPFTELHYYRRADFEGLPLPKSMAFDPSLGRTKKADFQALVTLRGPTAEGKILVHRARFYRIGDPRLLVETVNADRLTDDPDVAQCEAISAGSIIEMLLTSQLLAAGALEGWVRIERQEEGKDLRIRSLAPLVNGGTIVFPDDGSCRELELQFLGYGTPGAKRDGPDVTEMALRPLRQRPRTSSDVRHTPRATARPEFWGDEPVRRGRRAPRRVDGWA